MQAQATAISPPKAGRRAEFCRLLRLCLGEVKLPRETGSCLCAMMLMACRSSFGLSAFSGQTLRTCDSWHVQAGTHWCISLLRSFRPLLWVIVCTSQVLICAPLELESGRELKVALGPALKWHSGHEMRKWDSF